MLPRSRRLRSKEVRSIIATGQSVRTHYTSMKFVPTAGFFRAAVVVSKKIAKTAVLRNKLRRAMYTSLRTINQPRNISAVFFVHSIPPKPLTLSFFEDLTLCFKRFS